jgi:hypothetical protein
MKENKADKTDSINCHYSVTPPFNSRTLAHQAFVNFILRSVKGLLNRIPFRGKIVSDVKG